MVLDSTEDKAMTGPEIPGPSDPQRLSGKLQAAVGYRIRSPGGLGKGATMRTWDC